MLDFETLSSKLEVSKSNSWKITSFSKTTSLQREPFLTMFYNFKSSPLLVTKEVFMLTIILSNLYLQCPLPLSVSYLLQMFDRTLTRERCSIKYFFAKQCMFFLPDSMRWKMNTVHRILIQFQSMYILNGEKSGNWAANVVCSN